MFKISYDKKITMVQGDTGVIRMKIHNYELSQGDEVRFAIVNKATPSILLCQHSDKKIVLEKQVTVFEKDGSARIVIHPDDTEYLQPGKYLYEIQVKTKDGRIDTVVPLASFTLMNGSIQGEFGQTTPSKPELTPSEIELRFRRLENEIIPELGNRITNVENEIDNISSTLDKIEIETNEKLTSKNDLGTFLKIKKDDFIDTTNYTVDDYYNLFQTLVNASRFDWINLGKDQSNTYDIRMYRYVPTTYNSTLFITCAVHGWEHYGSYIMYELFKMLLSDNDLPLQFKELRNTRILCIPIANPWGLMADNHAGYNATRRGNSRGVDLNRNFDYRWEQNSGGFGLSKGDAPFSEKETQYIKKIMDEYIITHYLDLHSFNNSSSESRDYLFYGNSEAKRNTYQFINWLFQIYPGVKIEHTITENDSSANNYANRIKSIPSMNIELIKNRYGEDDNRRWLELLINYLSLQSQSHKSLYYNGVGCKFYQREPYVIQTTVPENWGKVENLKIELDANTDGIVIVNGFMCVNISGGDSTTTLTFSPSLSQKNFYTAKPVTARSRPYLKQSSGSMYLPFSCQMFVKKGGGKIIFEVDIIKEGSGTLTIMRSDATYMYIPTLAYDYQMRQHNIVENDYSDITDEG